jgi:hypothetical protein
MKLNSVFKCPYCGFEREETMPTTSCQILYRCTYCNKSIHPKKGDCCVFCSYGSEQCPPKQEIAAM